MFAVYADFHLCATSSKYVAEYRKTRPIKAARILHLVFVGSLALCAVVAVILVCFAPFLAKNTLHLPRLQTPLMMGALLLFFLAFGNVLENAITGFEAFKTLAKISFQKGVLTPLIVLPLTYFFSVNGAVAGTALVAALMLVPLTLVLRKEKKTANFPVRISFQESMQEKSILWIFALPGFLTAILITFMQWYGRIILSQQEGGYFELGLFSAADQWRTLILFLPAVVSKVMLPILSDTHGNNRDEFKSVIALQFQVVLAIAMPLTIATITFAQFLAAIFGKQYMDIDSIIPLLMATAFFFSLNQAGQIIFDGSGKRWLSLAIYSGWAVVFFICCILLIPVLRAKGFAIALLTAQATVFFVQYLFINLKISPGSLNSLFVQFIFSFSILTLSIITQMHLDGKYIIFANSILVFMSFYPMKKIFNQYFQSTTGINCSGNLNEGE